eukprot:NODE_67_length_25542_cov_1.476831.p2 type:complete len:609 gc:universal NODE_67_length_25542_cov_1.476831:23122-24948(+)
MLIDVLQLATFHCIYFSVNSSTPMNFQERAVVNLHTLQEEKADSLPSIGGRVFGCFLPQDSHDVIIMQNSTDKVAVHMVEPIVKHLNIHHDIYHKFVSLFHHSHVQKRDLKSILAIREIISFIGKLGHTFNSYLRHIAKKLHVDSILRTMSFYTHYFSLVVPVVEKTVNIKRFSEINTKSSEHFKGNLDDSNHDILLHDDSLTIVDGRVQMMKDVILPHLMNADLTSLHKKYNNSGFSPLENPSSLPNRPYLKNIMELLSSFQVSARSGKLALDKIMNLTTGLLPTYYQDMLTFLTASIPIMGLNTFLKSHFNIEKPCLLTLFLIIVSTEGTYTFMAYKGMEPFSTYDIKLIQNVSDGQELLYEWLVDSSTGPSDPKKEYEIRIKLDWFPRMFSAVIQQINLTMGWLLPGYLYSILYALDSFLIALCVFPMPYSFGNSVVAIQKLNNWSFGWWYLWSYSCVSHLARVPLNFIDPKRENYLQSWFQFKALAIAIPQAYLCMGLVKQLKLQLDMSNPIHSTHFYINVFSWAMDTLSMMTPFKKGLDPYNLATTGMVVGYAARIHWMMKHGLPGVVPYYNSFYQTNSTTFHIGFETSGAGVHDVRKFWTPQ